MSELSNAQAAALAAAAGGSLMVAGAQLSVPGFVSPAISGGETIIWEGVVDLDKVAGGAGVTIGASFDIEFSCAVTGLDAATINLRIGSTTPGSTAGSTVRATLGGITTSAGRLAGNAGAAFASPGGRVLVQLTGNIAGTSNITITVVGAHLKIGL